MWNFHMLKAKGVKNPLIMNSTEDRTRCMQDTTSESGREVGTDYERHTAHWKSMSEFHKS